MKISIVLPAHNEEEKIHTILSDLTAKFPNSEMIVVCNACTDSTPQIVENFGKVNKNVKCINLTQLGKGIALIEGFKHAKGEIVGYVDADYAFDANDVFKIISELKNSDCVIASKWKGQKFSSAYGSFGRKVASRIWNFLVKILLGLEFQDTQAGLKFFKKEVFDSIDKDFVCKGFAFDAELLYKIKNKGFKIKEVYIKPKPTRKSTFSFKHAPKMLFDIIKLRLNSQKK
jgi:glycosyltransferase involved in cell wall biosynthesis